MSDQIPEITWVWPLCIIKNSSTEVRVWLLPHPTHPPLLSHPLLTPMCINIREFRSVISFQEEHDTLLERMKASAPAVKADWGNHCCRDADLHDGGHRRLTNLTGSNKTLTLLTDSDWRVLGLERITKATPEYEEKDHPTFRVLKIAGLNDWSHMVLKTDRNFQIK